MHLWQMSGEWKCLIFADLVGVDCVGGGREGHSGLGLETPAHSHLGLLEGAGEKRGREQHHRAPTTRSGPLHRLV